MSTLFAKIVILARRAGQNHKKMVRRLLHEQECHIACHYRQQAQHPDCGFLRLEGGKRHYGCNQSEYEQVLHLDIGKVVDVASQAQHVCNAEYHEVEEVASHDIADGDVVALHAEQGDGGRYLRQRCGHAEEYRTGESHSDIVLCGKVVGYVCHDYAEQYDAYADQCESCDYLARGEGYGVLVILFRFAFIAGEVTYTYGV